MEAQDSITEGGYGAEFILLRYTVSYFLLPDGVDDVNAMKRRIRT